MTNQMTDPHHNIRDPNGVRYLFGDLLDDDWVVVDVTNSFLYLRKPGESVRFPCLWSWAGLLKVQRRACGTIPTVDE